MIIKDGPLKDNEAEAWFINDAPEGDCIVECGACRAETIEDRCSNCGRDFVYRPWWSW